MSGIIKVELSNDDSSEVVQFNVADVLAHHAESRTWEELAAADSNLQMSLAEDYALYNFKRLYGDLTEYRVDVVSGLTDEEDGDSEMPSTQST